MSGVLGDDEVMLTIRPGDTDYPPGDADYPARRAWIHIWRQSSSLQGTVYLAVINFLCPVCTLDYGWAT